MKVFIAILALVGAVAASHIPDHVDVEKAIMAGAAPIVRGVVDDMKIVSVFAAPKFARDAYLPSEKYGIRGIYDKPVIVAFKNAEKKSLDAFLLKDGLLSAFTMPEYAFMRNAILSGPAKVGLMLSAARYLDMPEMALPVPSIMMPVDSTLATAFRLNSMVTDKYPWVFVTEKDSIRTSMLDKLVELGQFNVNAEKLAIAREAPLAVRGASLAANDAVVDDASLSASLSAAGLRRAYLADSFDTEPAYDRLSSLSSLSPLGYRIVRTNPYRNIATAAPVASGISSGISSGIAPGIAFAHGEVPVYHVRSSALDDAASIDFATHKFGKHYVPSATNYFVQ